MNDKIRDNSERRNFSRVDFHHEIILTNQDGQVFRGAFSDVSLRGMLFQSNVLPRMKDNIQGNLRLGDIDLVIQGIVVHSSEGRGAAIQFQDLDLESFSHLRRLVSLNLGDS
ncbi:MAG TPA: PilZ domain-containing protein, partial [Magnetococcales bacterium]|nr:PilZ domain-containing protein [Magnetococcales bacterium]